jgi:hypothetical protein
LSFMRALYIALLCMASSKPHPTGAQDVGKSRKVQVIATRKNGKRIDDNQ